MKESEARRALEAHLISRALRDDEFKRLLISDPRATLESEIKRLGLPIRLPDGLKVRVLQEEADTIYLVLPPSLIAPMDAPERLLREATERLHGESD